MEEGIDMPPVDLDVFNGLWRELDTAATAIDESPPPDATSGIGVGSLTPYSSGIDSIGAATETDSDNFSQLVTPVSETLESPVYEPPTPTANTPTNADVANADVTNADVTNADANIPVAVDGVNIPVAAADVNNIPVAVDDINNIPVAVGRVTTAANRHRSDNCTCVLCESSVRKKKRGPNAPPSPPPPVHRRRRKHHVSVVYQSQISPDKNGIKLKIKKSPPGAQFETAAPVGRGRRRGGGAGRDGKGRKRRAKQKEASEDEDEAYGGVVPREDFVPDVPSKWGDSVPTTFLTQVFKAVTYDEGCLPFLLRACRVCRLWRQVALNPTLWHTIDLSARRVKDKFRSELRLIWLCQNRMSRIQELNLGGWNQALTVPALEAMATACQGLRGLTLTGCWKLSPENLKFLVQSCQELSKLDLAGVTPLSANPRSVVSPAGLSEVLPSLGGRLTHLSLANNCMSGLGQVIQALAQYCPNLTFLDLSNLRSTTRNIVPVNIECLQKGCAHLRVLRLTNSMLHLATTPIKDQVGSPGFPELEEISIAVDGKGYFSGMDDSSVERVLKTSHKLRLLDVRGCGRISDSSLVRVPAWDLEHLFLSGCYATKSSSDGLELIVQKWRHSLVEVDLSWTSATHALDLAISALAEDADQSPLRSLDLCGSSVSFEPVKQLLTTCRRLSTLNLSSCRALPRGLKRLYQGAADVAQLRASVTGGRFDSSEEEEIEAPKTVAPDAAPAGQVTAGEAMAVDGAAAKEEGSRA